MIPRSTNLTRSWSPFSLWAPVSSTSNVSEPREEQSWGFRVSSPDFGLLVSADLNSIGNRISWWLESSPSSMHLPKAAFDDRAGRCGGDCFRTGIGTSAPRNLFHSLSRLVSRSARNKWTITEICSNFKLFYIECSKQFKKNATCDRLEVEPGSGGGGCCDGCWFAGCL